MRAIQKILVPVDFSPCSNVALEYARFLAERFGASLLVFHAWELPGYVRPDMTVWATTGGSATLEQHIRRDADLAMRHFLAAAGVGEDQRVGSRVVPGVPHLTILEEAERGAYDLIVMGTHGRAGLARIVMGSVAEKVVRRATCPVMTVHAPHSTDQKERSAQHDRS